MSVRLSPVLVLPAIVAGALAAYVATSHRLAAAGTTVAGGAASPAATEAAKEAPLPANHPRVEGMSRAPNPNSAMPNGENQKPPSIDWKVPGDWQVLPNANPMRLATYRIGVAGEGSISRAGGPIDANILRWSQQFEGAPAAARTDKQVNGLHVTVVHLQGTYSSSGMGVSSPEKHENWAMLAAIVEAPGAPYFVKLLGPVAEVDHARNSFESLIDSITPRAAQ